MTVPALPRKAFFIADPLSVLCLLKGNGFSVVAPHIRRISLFAAVVLFVGVRRYRRTLY